MCTSRRELMEFAERTKLCCFSSRRPEAILNHRPNPTENGGELIRSEIIGQRFVLKKKKKKKKK